MIATVIASGRDSTRITIKIRNTSSIIIISIFIIIISIIIRNRFISKVFKNVIFLLLLFSFFLWLLLLPLLIFWSSVSSAVEAIYISSAHSFLIVLDSGKVFYLSVICFGFGFNKLVM